MTNWIRRLLGIDGSTGDEVCVRDPETTVEQRYEETTARAYETMARAKEQTELACDVAKEARLRLSRNAIANTFAHRRGST